MENILTQQQELIATRKRGFDQSADTFVDVPMGSDAHQRTLRDYVHAHQIANLETKQAMAEAFGNGDCEISKFDLRCFTALEPVMQFTPDEFDNKDVFNLWMVEELVPQIKQWIDKAHSMGRTGSRQTIVDRLSKLEKWMALHNVNPIAVETLLNLRRGELWNLLGDLSPPTKKAARQAKQFTDDRVIAIRNRIDDLLTNPDARPLYEEALKKGEKILIGPSRVKMLDAAFHVGLNATMRSGEMQDLLIGDVRGALGRKVKKESASTCGLTIVEALWPSTSDVVEEYIQSRRLAKHRTDDAKLFPKNIEMVWRSLCKDALGDAWTTGMGLHNFSRTRGLSAMASEGATVSHLKAASGATLAAVEKYVANANLDKARLEGNDMRKKNAENLGIIKQGMSAEQVLGLHELMDKLWLDASLELSAMTGEPQMAHAPALYQCKLEIDEDGNRKVTASDDWRREGDLNSQTVLSLIEALRTESQAAIDAWMDGDTKTALDLLKTIAGVDA